VEIPDEVTFSYLIWGIPVPPTILNNITVGELQAFSNDVAAGIAAQTGAAADKVIGDGSVYLGAGHILCGIPPAEYTAMRQ
jgi:hypothetical protein